MTRLKINILNNENVPPIKYQKAESFNKRDWTSPPLADKY